MNNVKNIYKRVFRNLKLGENEFVNSISDLRDGTYLFWIGNTDTSREYDIAAEITYMYDSKTDEIKEINSLDALDMVTEKGDAKNIYVRDILKEAV